MEIPSDSKAQKGIQGLAKNGPLIGPPSQQRGAAAVSRSNVRGLTVVGPCGFLALLLTSLVLLLLAPCSEAFLNQKATSAIPHGEQTDVLALQAPAQAAPVKAPRLWGLRRPSFAALSPSAQSCRTGDGAECSDDVKASVLLPAVSLLQHGLHHAFTPPLLLTRLGATGLLGYYLSLTAFGYGLFHLRLWWKRRGDRDQDIKEGYFLTHYDAYTRPHAWALAAAHRQRRRIGRLSFPVHHHAKALISSTRTRILGLLSSSTLVEHSRRFTAPTRQEALDAVGRHMHAASSALACLLSRMAAFLLQHPLTAPLTIAPPPSLPLPPSPPPVSPYESLYPPSPFDALLIPTPFHPRPTNLTTHVPSPYPLNDTAPLPLPLSTYPHPPLVLQSRAYTTLPLLAVLWLCMLYIVAMLMLGRWPIALPSTPLQASVPPAEPVEDLTPAVAAEEEAEADKGKTPEEEGEEEQEAVEEEEVEEKQAEEKREVVVQMPGKPQVVINEADFFDARREGSDESSEEEEDEAEVVAKEEGKGMEQEEDAARVERERREEERRQEEEGEMARQEQQVKERVMEDRWREEGEREGMNREEGQQRAREGEERREKEGERAERAAMEREEGVQRNVEAGQRERVAQMQRWEREREEQRRAYGVDTRPVCVSSAQQCIHAIIDEVSTRTLRQRVVQKRNFVLQHMGFMRECVNKGIEQGEAGRVTFRERELSTQAVDYVDRKVTRLAREWDDLLALGHEMKTICTRAAPTYKDWVMYPFDTELQAARVDYLHFALDRLHRLEEQREAIAHHRGSSSEGAESSNNGPDNQRKSNNHQEAGAGKGGASRGAAAVLEEEAETLRQEEAGRTQAMYRVNQGLPPQPYVPNMADTEPAQ